VEGKLAWQGGRSEEATYEAGDAEDVAASAAAQAQAARQAGEVEVSMRCRVGPQQRFCFSCQRCCL
jgi:hypothetical protein